MTMILRNLIKYTTAIN